MLCHKCQNVLVSVSVIDYQNNLLKVNEYQITAKISYFPPQRW